MSKHLVVSEKYIQIMYHSHTSSEVKRKMRDKFKAIDFLKKGELVYIKSGGSGAFGADENFGVIVDQAKGQGCIESGIHVKVLDGSVWSLNPESMDIYRSSMSEIKTYLTNTAQKKGFVKGAKVKGLDNEEFIFEELDFWNFKSEIPWNIDKEIESIFNISAHRGDGRVIFRRGKWADVIKEKDLTIREAEEKLKHITGEYYRIKT